MVRLTEMRLPRVLVRIVIVVGGSAVAIDSNRRPIGLSLGGPGIAAVGERLRFQLVFAPPSDITLEPGTPCRRSFTWVPRMSSRQSVGRDAVPLPPR